MTYLNGLARGLVAGLCPGLILAATIWTVLQ